MNKKPQRKCIGCRNSFEKSQLIRIAGNKDKKIIIDPKGKEEGRGAYICKDESCLKKAFKKNQLEYALKIKIKEDEKENLLTCLSELIGNKIN